MNGIEQMEHDIVQSAVESIPRGFFKEFQERGRRAYSDMFSEIKADSTVIEEHRLAKLRQVRPFRMDRELMEAARNWGMSFTATPIAHNDWRHGYAVSGRFGLTQSYVQKIGDLPIPAKFRETLASRSAVPELDLHDDMEVFLPRSFYALITHNPVGDDFNEDAQKMGNMQFCVPYPAMKGWAVTRSVVELIALYAVEDNKSTGSVVQPSFKKDAVRRKDKGSASS